MKKILALLALLPVLALAPVSAYAADNATDAFENKILDWLFRGQAAPTVTSYKVDAYSTCPTDSTAGTKISGTGYTQATITSGATAFKNTNGNTTAGGTGTTGTITNNAIIDFGVNSTGSSWTVNCVGISDSTGATLYIYMPVASAPVTVVNGATLTIAVDGMTLTFQ